MLNPKDFYDELRQNGISFFTGVPDSLLKEFCQVVESQGGKNHAITANEGGALALAAGRYLASGKISCVYLQNSGLGNIINPLLSLNAPEVYGIPALLLIGWRGEILEDGSQLKDEPQHAAQGRLTLEILRACEVRFEILESNFEAARSQVKSAVEYMKKQKRVFAFVVKKGTFLGADSAVESKESIESAIDSKREINREFAIQKIAAAINEKFGTNAAIVATTGHISRELYEHNRAAHPDFASFYNVGSMGFASTIAFGVARNCAKSVFCLDGDGAFLMHLGNLAAIAQARPANFKHIVLNNFAHVSVGGGATPLSHASITATATALGYERAFCINNLAEFDSVLGEFLDFKGLVLLEIIVSKAHRSDLARPKESPAQNKAAFMKALGVKL